MLIWNLEPKGNQPAELAKQFEKFVRSLLETYDLQVIDRAVEGADFMVTTSIGTTAAVEVKLYLSQSVGGTVLRNAALSLASVRKALGTTRSILVTNIQVPQDLQAEFEKGYGVVIYDYDKLLFFVSGRPEFRAQWDSITSAAALYRSGPPPSPNVNDRKSTPSDDINNEREHPEVHTAPSRGKKISDEVSLVKAGKDGASAFEKICAKALQYIFEDDLTAWLEQPVSDTGLNRYDMIARIVSIEGFWTALVQDYRTRYVIFEFKNYEKPIKQTQIYTTEKYLYPAAMRSTAIILSREGADDNALAATRGALRESGKLILNISVAELKEMLLQKDKGKSASDALAVKLDQMLVGIER